MSDETNNATKGGSYEVLRARLIARAGELAAKAEALNALRQQTFGGTELTIVGNERVRTEHNCIARDIVQVGGLLLFGYNVTLHMKQEVAVSDVLSLHRFRETEGGFTFDDVDPADTFLADPNFVREFKELYQYYKQARLAQLRRTEDKLLAVFQVGNNDTDIKVFRWALDGRGGAAYIDNRGERDHTFPPSHDFDWVRTTRDDHVHGRHPHVNVLDEVFVETVGGDLTVKIEDNTADGEGIYSEPVDDRNQSLDDAEIAFASLGSLILLSVLPYQERDRRYLVFNRQTRQVVRIDAIGQACVQLPEDHGVLFPGGYYLQTGDYKVFDDDTSDLEFKRAIRSPNGEDVLYIFLRRREGQYVLFPYNLIRKEVATPIHCHGYSLFDDGRLVIFRAEAEPSRVHLMRIWQTPFVSAEHAAAAPSDDSFLGRVGNADLVRGISDALTVRRLAASEETSRERFEELVRACTRMVDSYYWLSSPEVDDLAGSVQAVRRAAELIIDEYEKVLALQRKAAAALKAAVAEQSSLLSNMRPETWRQIDPFLSAMTALRRQRGQLITMKEIRYVDLTRLEALEAEVVEHFDRVSRGCVEFLLGEEALAPLIAQLDALLEKIGGVDRAADIAPLQEELEATTEGLNLLSEVVAGLEVDDATVRTTLLERISEVFSQLNRVRAVLQGRRTELMTHEGRAEFAAQMKLFSQAVSSALSRADTPEACDSELSRLMLQLEEMEARFGEFDEFIGELASRREEAYQGLTSKKQNLLDARQRRVGSLSGAADRILEGIVRRAGSFKEEDALNAWFAADPMVLKVRQIAEQLEGLADPVKAEELLARLKSARQDALRGLRDRRDLFTDGDSLIRLGKHSFSVNTQALELTVVPRGEGMAFHLTGTDYYAPIEGERWAATRPYWDQLTVSEDGRVYRGEYLAASLLFDAEAGAGGLSVEKLQDAAIEDGGLLALARQYASERYEEGYERGVHDADAAKILEKLLSLRQSAGLLRFPARPRAAALLTAAFHPDRERLAAFARRARSLGRLRDALGDGAGLRQLAVELAGFIGDFVAASGLDLGALEEAERALAGAYLAEELSAVKPRYTVSGDAAALRDGLLRHLDTHGGRRPLEEDLQALEGAPAERLQVARSWIGGWAARDPERAGAALEASALLAATGRLDFEPSSALTRVTLEGMLGQHPRIRERKLTLALDEFLSRLTDFRETRAPAWRAYRELRHQLIDEERHRLRVDEFQPRVLSAFVRNKLISEVYLHLVGDNLAKQMGAAGASKRTDLMGMLLLISPPGYGKTTLMEYVANRLGLVFMKVNGPALGHDVHSLDPAEAPSATARQEVEKINLAFEMGNNVMLYLDDIQHTHPELLQKFISLCDGQRRVEGVWKGRTRTYDLRGKKFCVVMAGNPYTESGDKFQIPDMLANRADTYNLGDILSGREETFALSYIENALTSNPALAPLATRAQGDVYKLVRMARGEDIPASELSHDYSAVELTEIKAVLGHLFAARDVLLKVNAQYIASAATEDAFRTEPRFQLQGSYRNMNKLAEKIVPAMNAEELEALVSDHYIGEAQTLTTGAEANLLKLAELRANLTADQAARWAAIKKEFARQKMMGGGDDDPVARVTGTLASLKDPLEAIAGTLDGGAGVSAAMSGELAQIRATLKDSSGLGEQLGAFALAMGGQMDGLREALEAGAGAGVGEKVEGVSRQLAALARVLGQAPRVSGDLEALTAQLLAIREVLERAPAAPSQVVYAAPAGYASPAPAQPAVTAALPPAPSSPRQARPSAPPPASPRQAARPAMDPAAPTYGADSRRGLSAPSPGETVLPTSHPGYLPQAGEAPGLHTDWLTRGPTGDPAAQLRARRDMLEAVQAALAGDLSPPSRAREQAVTAALPVLHGMGVKLSQLSERYLTAGDQQRFMDELRRYVADALAEIARLQR
jgi:MoxR-like ATPase